MCEFYRRRSLFAHSLQKEGKNGMMTASHPSLSLDLVTRCIFKGFPISLKTNGGPLEQMGGLGSVQSSGEECVPPATARSAASPPGIKGVSSRSSSLPAPRACQTRRPLGALPVALGPGGPGQMRMLRPLTLLWVIKPFGSDP